MVPREICLQIIVLLRRMFIVFKAGGTMRAEGHLPSRFWLISYSYILTSAVGQVVPMHINTCPPRLSDFPPALVLLRLIAACRQRILGGYGHWEENEWRYKDWPPQDGGREWDVGSHLHCFLKDSWYLPCDPAMLSRRKWSGDPPETPRRPPGDPPRGGVSGYFG